MPLNLTIVLILLGGWIFGKLFSKIGLPSVLGMLVWGVCIGVLWGDRIPAVVSDVEPFLKSFALIVILLRAGLGINRSTLRKAGLTAGLISFIPCIIEGTVLTVLFLIVFGFDWAVAGLTGFMVAAVSPAVIVPSMLNLKDDGYGRENEVPTIVLAGASVDDVFAITVFTLFLQLATAGDVAVREVLFQVPLSLLLGIIPGIIAGFGLVLFFRKKHPNIRATEKIIILLMISVVLVQIGEWVQMAALLGVMTIGFILLEYEEKIAHEISEKLSSVWVVAEIVLFVLIGMSVNPVVAWNAGLRGIIVISIGLLFRSAGVLVATIWSDLTLRERFFCMIAFFPKATVQAALGGVALANGIGEGDTILAIAVLAIMFTAPMGLLGIKFGGKRLLTTQTCTGAKVQGT